jgi:hypothetical protein
MLLKAFGRVLMLRVSIRNTIVNCAGAAEAETSEECDRYFDSCRQLSGNNSPKVCQLVHLRLKPRYPRIPRTVSAFMNTAPTEARAESGFSTLKWIADCYRANLGEEIGAASLLIAAPCHAFLTKGQQTPAPSAERKHVRRQCRARRRRTGRRHLRRQILTRRCRRKINRRCFSRQKTKKRKMMIRRMMNPLWEACCRRSSIIPSSRSRECGLGKIRTRS